MKIEIDISSQQIADIMTSAIESNNMTRAWCASINCICPKKPEDLWYANPAFYDDPAFLIEINEIIDESKPVEGDNIKQHICGPLCFVAGLKVMATTNPHHFGDWLNENADAVTADVFLQCVALGEVVYG